ncbi:hypothetical protein K493DRAFT_263323 [Basidiobolus meristosporus CBS 931.73]|uniref:Diphthine--ammonia ligase n=1 Tax=Basidiobolus meristosporus CBS 931.73 TaxID=1314790 RepID=A0A1Y1Y3F9_9FUNG|nr:hypothetical protein K493DRAFT_263323 [Basidiobolus meristosporus CBS 931.73]|eukprot:ORX92572.1 hypothetical protein K493DRAFT_263323 [Basidiobolus meristosporus CBS 931.73]
MMQCVANGHEIVALANLRPPPESGKDELDSFMFQTVGHDIIDFYSECMQLPLYRHSITGSSVLQTMDYTVTLNDETEDLLALLSEVKSKHPEVEGVSVGAILSNYQRIRVEHVCSRLGLTSLAYLWRQDQHALLEAMIRANVNAVLIKVAAIGLKPTHLGKSIGQLYDYLNKMNNLYDLHVCGEGGEYETFTLDCPLFKKRIVLDEVETIIHSDDAFATVAYLRVKKAHVEDKDEEEIYTPTEKIVSSIVHGEDEDLLMSLQSLSAPSYKDSPKVRFESGSESADNHISSSENPPFYAFGNSNAYRQSIQSNPPSTIEEETELCMKDIQEQLVSRKLSLGDIATVNVYVDDMASFAQVNQAYKRYFGINPPSRACVQLNLPSPHRVQIDCIAAKRMCTAGEAQAAQVERDTLHVQGLSYWAPANIGPYSQAVVVQNQIYVAGQIGLIPSSLSLPGGSDDSESFFTEAVLSLRHISQIAEIFACNIEKRAALCICYVSEKRWLPLCQQIWESRLKLKEDCVLPPFCAVVVPALPRSAKIEWQTILFNGVPKICDPDSDSDSESGTHYVEHNACPILSEREITNEYKETGLMCRVKARQWTFMNLCTAVATLHLASEAEEIALSSPDRLIQQLMQEIYVPIDRFEKIGWKAVLQLRIFHLDCMSGESLRTAMARYLTAKHVEELPVIHLIPVAALPDGGYISVCVQATVE